MCLLVIRCPQTGREVWTGIETDPGSFTNIPDGLFYTYCPHCRHDHAWWPDEAWLAYGMLRQQPLTALASSANLSFPKILSEPIRVT
jgi:hypothetical protein